MNASLRYMYADSERHMESLIGMMQSAAPDSLGLDAAIRESFEGIRSSSHSAVAAAHSGGSPEAGGEGGGLSFKFLWGAMMSVILCFFLISCISQFAQFYQTMLNGLESERLHSLLSTRHVRSLSGGSRRSPAAELFFSSQIKGGVTSPAAQLVLSAAKSFARKIESQKSPKYDLVYLSTSSAGMESEID
jgi:hypothetical protein